MSILNDWLNEQADKDGGAARSNYDIARSLGVSEAQVRIWRRGTRIHEKWLPNFALAMGIPQRELRSRLDLPALANDAPPFVRKPSQVEPEDLDVERDDVKNLSFDELFSLWSFHWLGTLNVELEYGRRRGLSDPGAAHSELWDTFAMAHGASKGERPFIPPWREDEVMRQAQDWVDEFGPPRESAVGPDEYDYDQIAARRTAQVPVEQQIEHIDPVLEDGAPGED